MGVPQRAAYSNLISLSQILGQDFLFWGGWVSEPQDLPPSRCTNKAWWLGRFLHWGKELRPGPRWNQKKPTFIFGVGGPGLRVQSKRGYAELLCRESLLSRGFTRDRQPSNRSPGGPVHDLQ